MDLGQFQSKKEPNQSRADKIHFLAERFAKKGSGAGGEPPLLLQSTEPEMEMGQAQCLISELQHKYQCMHHF